MKTILLDVDGVLADFVGGVCKSIGHDGFQLHPEDVNHLNLHKVLSKEAAVSMESRIHERGWCASLDWYKSARVFVDALKDLGDVWAVTAPFKCATWCAERLDWLQSVIPRNRVIFAESKWLVQGDYMIEDSIPHLMAWGGRPGRKAILLDRPWNQAGHIDGISRARSYSEVLKLVMA